MRTIWILDAEQWPRALLRAELIERGHDAAGYVTVEDASRAVRERFQDLIIVELRGVSRDEVAQLFQLGAPVMGIVSIPEPDWLHQFGWAKLFRRPVSIGEIADACEALPPPGPLAQ